MSGISGLENVYFGTTASGVSTLFGSLSKPTGVSSLASLVSDYNSINTGTYGRLLKAYYKSENTDSDGTKSKATDAATKAATALKNSYSDVKSKADSLSSAANALTATGSDSLFKKKLIANDDGTSEEGYDMDSIYNAASKFASSYNSMLTTAKSSSGTSVSSGVSSMKSTTQVMGSRLKQIGITTDKDGLLSIDKDTFKSADIDRIKELFSGSSSYASTIASTAKRVSGTASNQLSTMSTSAWTYGKSATYSSATDFSSLFDSYS